MDSQVKDFKDEVRADITRLETTVDSQVKDFKDEVRADITRLETTMNAQVKELRDEMRAMAARVSNSELEQARLNGINSILGEQTHTHEVSGD